MRPSPRMWKNETPPAHPAGCSSHKEFNPVPLTWPPCLGKQRGSIHVCCCCVRDGGVVSYSNFLTATLNSRHLTHSPTFAVGSSALCPLPRSGHLPSRCEWNLLMRLPQSTSLGMTFHQCGNRKRWLASHCRRGNHPNYPVNGKDSLTLPAEGSENCMVLGDSASSPLQNAFTGAKSFLPSTIQVSEPSAGKC